MLVRSDSTIKDLHYIMQLLMGWSDYHLNRFTIHGKDYGVFHVGGTSFTDDPSEAHLADFQFRPKERFLYEYDFIDEWTFDIRLEQILPLDPRKHYPPLHRWQTYRPTRELWRATGIYELGR